jgi:hypothetical protein
MHLLLLSPLLAFDDPGVANSAAAFMVIQFVVAIAMSRKR